MIGDPVGLGDLHRPQPQRGRPSAVATAAARGVEPEIAANTPAKSAPSRVTVISGCRLNASWAPSTSSPETPEQCPTNGPGPTAAAAEEIASSGTHSSTSGVAGSVIPRPCGPETATPGSPQGGNDGGPEPAGTDHRERQRQVPTAPGAGSPEPAGGSSRDSMRTVGAEFRGSGEFSADSAGTAARAAAAGTGSRAGACPGPGGGRSPSGGRYPGGGGPVGASRPG